MFPDTSRTRYSHAAVDQDGPFLISLSHARLHSCTRSIPIIESKLRPAREAYGCDELYTVAAGMGIWNPGTSRVLPHISALFQFSGTLSNLSMTSIGEIAFFSSPVPLSRARSPEQLAREAPLRMQSTAAGWAEALRHAKKALAAHQARYGPIDYSDSDTDSDDGNVVISSPV